MADIREQIQRLKAERNAVILAHTYQIAEVQDIADFVGDSLALSRQAASTPADVIVFCGVHFMAETAAILSPEKLVLLPDPMAGCSLADQAHVAGVLAWRAEHPDGLVVAYVNTSAAVKAESDVCCTSANAVEVVASLPADKPLLFLPDMFLGNYVRQVTGRENMDIWMGECHVHAAMHPEDLDRARAAYPGAEVLVHPECGCSTPLLIDLEGAEHEGVEVLSTGGMVRKVQGSPHKEFVIATETGIIHTLRKAAPDKVFHAVSDEAECQYMKMTTLDKVLRSLENLQFAVRVPKETADRARISIERMLTLGARR